MRLSLHPNATESFNRRADELLSAVTAFWEAAAPLTGPALLISGIPVHVEVLWKSFQDSDVPSGVSFIADDKVVHLHEDDFLPMIRFAEEVQQRREISDFVGVQAVLNTLVTWYKARIAGTTSEPFLDLFFGWLQEHVVERTIVFPISELAFAGTLEVNGVEIRELQESEIDVWYKNRVARAPEAEWQSLQEQERDEWRRKIGGRAAAFVTVTAEPVRAREVAFQKVDRLLSIIRSFSPALIVPQRRSYSAIYGMEHVATVTSFTIDPSGWVGHSEEKIGGATWWNLDEPALQDLCGMGLLDTVALLEQEDPTDFQEAVVRSLVLYSRGATEGRVESKLLYIVAAIESLLLTDESEPVVSTVSRRFAYFVGDELNQRKEIRKRYLTAYKARSSFVHHGRTIDDYLMIRDFMSDAWWFFRKLVFYVAKHKDKLGFVSSIEDEMFAGPHTGSAGSSDEEEPPS